MKIVSVFSTPVVSVEAPRRSPNSTVLLSSLGFLYILLFAVLLKISKNLLEFIISLLVFCFIVGLLEKYSYSEIISNKLPMLLKTLILGRIT